MRKIWKQAVSALLAGMMVLQSAPALAAGAIYGIGSLPKLIDTQSRIVSGAARGTGNNATLSDAVVSGLVFDGNEYIVDLAGETVTLTGTITLASDSVASTGNASSSNAIWASASDAERSALFTYEVDDDGMLTNVSVEAFENKTFKVTATAGESLDEYGTDVTIYLKDNDSVYAETHVALNNQLIDDVNGVKVTPSSMNMTVGETRQLDVTATPADAALTYESSDPAVATVNNAGEVTALSEGDAQIKVSLDDFDVESAYCDVHVTPVPVTPPTTEYWIQISPESMDMTVGETSTLEATASPADAALVYESTNPAVATVNNAGEVTALSAGDARIKVSLDGFDVEPAYCDVHVTSVPVTPPTTEYWIQISPESMDLKVGETNKLNVTASPADATLVYESSDSNVATVSDKGEVTALSAGYALIKVSLDGYDNVEPAYCEVTVTAESLDNLDDIIKNLGNLYNVSGAAQTIIVKDIVTAVADLEISEDDMKDEDVVAKLEIIEAALVDCGYYEAPTVDVADNVGINVETPVGMILSLDPEKHQGCKPVLSLKKSEENVTLPSGITNTFALDIQILAKNDEKDTSESITTLNVPVVIKAETPEALISALKLGRMLVYHYHGTTTSPKTLTPELLDDGAAFSITVKEFSTFVLAAKVYNSSSSSSSSGGGGGSSSVGKTSTPNLSGTWVQDTTGWWFKLTNGGYPAGNWGRINNKWYYFNAQGYMMTGWVQVSGKWYYLQPAGDMVESNWVFDQNCWYYLEKDGAMSAGKWFQYKNNWYYLGANGAMAVNTATPDGYQVNAEGIWIQ